MKKLFLMGRSEAGKTSLTQALKGEELRYVKTQYTTTEDNTIDTPGEYAESKHFSVGLACFSFEADVIALVQAADEPFNLFGEGLHSFILRPLIGVITKIDSPYANIPMVRQWMENAGCERIFLVNNTTGEGVSELLEYLEEDLPPLTMEQAKQKQNLGLNPWNDFPENM
ncbi:MAG: ethanolamine utilization protein EutP [Tyzzerella sp.]|nr:ethanolamine utilization protein EutP [Tyzzerella sp.]